MMRAVYTLLLSCCVIVLLKAQISPCENGYMPFWNGSIFELTSYNAKGKMGSVVQHEIIGMEDTKEGLKATVNMQILDDKGKPAQNSTYSITCGNDVLQIDMQSLLNPETFAAFGSMQVDVTGEALAIPHTLQPGQTLPDAEMHINAAMSGISIIKMSFSITNRKVTGSEKLTTPAGVFDCVKLSQSTTISGFGNRTYESTTWLARGVGTVRIENYNKKGDLDTYSELTKFNR